MKNRLLVLLAISAMLLYGTAINIASEHGEGEIKDHGKAPWVVDIEELTLENTNFRIAHWTGEHLQMTVMSIPAGGEIGLELHSHNDQFIRIESGTAQVVMGEKKDELKFNKNVSDDWAVFIPAGFWHNIINTGDEPLKVYVIYSPPEHEAGTVHKTFEESEADHHHH